MINLRLTTEYMATPIFCTDPEEMGHLDVDDLPISDALKKNLKNWYQEYQSTFNEEHPQNSGFCSLQMAIVHAKKGESIAKQMQIELGENYRVEYSI